MSENFPKVLAKSLYEDFQSGKADKITSWAKSHNDPAVKGSAEPMVKYLKSCKNFDEFYTVLNGGTIDTPVKLTAAEMQAVAGGRQVMKAAVSSMRVTSAKSKWPWE
jgi:hypothetical protein